MSQHLNNFILALRLIHVYVILVLVIAISIQQRAVTQCLDGGGNNIFLAGDFGTGIVNVISSDPNLAPGYLYTPVVPPNDGEYVITNNMALWPNIWLTWLRIGDNSSDPNGYMMVVNASFTAGIFFEELVTDLCEQTTYNFSADIINLIEAPTLNHILPDISFFIDGVEKFSTGSVQQDEIWHTYEFSFETQVGQTSINLSLRNNANGGFGNDVGLDNISFRPCGPNISIASIIDGPLCEGLNSFKIAPFISGNFVAGVYQWQESLDNGMNWNNIAEAQHRDSLTFNNLPSSIYYYRLIFATSVNGLTNDKCLTPSNEVLVIVPPLNFYQFDTICSGSTFPFNNQLLSTTGSYHAQYISSLNCDSIVNLTLTIIDDPPINADVISQPPTCASESDGQIDVLSIINGAEPFDININGEEFILSEFPISLPSGTYEIEILDRYGCGFNETVDINDPAPFIIENVSDTLINLGDSVLIEPTSNYLQYTSDWSRDSNIICSGCSKIWLRPFITQLYTGIFTNDNNCTIDIPFTIRVIPLRPIYIPDVFTPNDDNGINEMFTIYSPKNLISQVISFRVFDRWGNLVFKKNNFSPSVESNGWNGEFNGTKVISGIYVYVYEVEYFDGEIVEGKGSVTIL